MLVKKLLIAVCFFTAYNVSAQDINIITRGDTIILQNGAKFWIGEQITLGNPSLPNGGFSFIYFPELLHLTKKGPLNAKYGGQQATIKKFQRDGAYKGGFSYNIIVLEFSDRRRFWCDVAPALDSKEIINPFANVQQKHGGNKDNNTPKKKSNGPVVF
jgi:hypothetical protein